MVPTKTKAALAAATLISGAAILIMCSHGPPPPPPPPYADDMNAVPAQWPDLSGSSGPIDPPDVDGGGCVPGPCVFTPAGYSNGCGVFSDPTCTSPR